MLLYNVTMFTGVNMQPDAVERLAAIRTSSASRSRAATSARSPSTSSRTPDDFTVLAGSATTLYHALCAGCDGAILALASLLPDECVRMRELVRSAASRRSAGAAAPADRRSPDRSGRRMASPASKPRST